MKFSECYKSSSRTHPGEKTTGGDYQPEHSRIEHELLDPLFIRYSNDSQGESNNKIPLYIGRYKGRPESPGMDMGALPCRHGQEDHRRNSAGDWMVTMPNGGPSPTAFTILQVPGSWRAACTSKVDRSGNCYYCGAPGHTARVCTETCCLLYRHAGKEAVGLRENRVPGNRDDGDHRGRGVKSRG